MSAGIGEYFGFREREPFEERLSPEADRIYQSNLLIHRKGLDHIMSFVLIFNWLLGIFFAFIVSPGTWIGQQHLTNLHIWVAFLQGGFMALFPAYLAWFHSGAPVTRHVIAMSQCLFASLFVHLPGGRIETHFYYFGSLAFLAFYRDWKIVVTGTIFVAADHLLRGIFWPLSVFGSIAGNDWRWLEHAAWVVVMDIVLFLGIIIAEREVREIAEKRATVEDFTVNLENLVDTRTEELVVAKNETDTILNSIDEGLFVLHRENGHFRIGSQQSAAIKSIFETPSLPTQNFTTVIQNFFPESTVTSATNFLKMIQKETVTGDMVRDLNPLELVEAYIPTDAGERKAKHLQFHFRRLDARQTDFLVSVKDVTQTVELSRELRENQEKAEAQTQMLLSILHVGPGLLEDFMEGVEIELAVIENLMRQEKSPDALRESLEQVFRSAHSIKGNASLIDLKFLAQATHEFEQKVQELRDRSSLQWDDYLPLAFELTRLQGVYSGLKDLIARIQSFQSASGGQDQSAVGMIPHSIRQLLDRLGDEHGKQITFVSGNFKASSISNKYAYILRDILVQLARNSVYHGIENPDERLKIGKPAKATVELSADVFKDHFILKYREDGRAFEFEKIRAKAVQLGYGGAEESETWDRAKLIRFVFQPGFSTSAETNLTAGRGMGMDIIKQRVKTVGGELRLNYSSGQYLEFIFTFPFNEAFTNLQGSRT